MSKVKTQYTIVMGETFAKVGKKQATGNYAVGDYGIQAVGVYGIGTIIARGELLVEFKERNNLRNLNAFYLKRGITIGGHQEALMAIIRTKQTLY